MLTITPQPPLVAIVLIAPKLLKTSCALNSHLPCHCLVMWLSRLASLDNDLLPQKLEPHIRGVEYLQPQQRSSSPSITSIPLVMGLLQYIVRC